MCPELDLIAAFWRCLWNDLQGRGILDNEIPHYSMPYQQRAILERERIQERAEAYITSPDFEMWSDAAGIEPQTMREYLCR